MLAIVNLNSSLPLSPFPSSTMQQLDSTSEMCDNSCLHSASSTHSMDSLESATSLLSLSSLESFHSFRSSGSSGSTDSSPPGTPALRPTTPPPCPLHSYCWLAELPAEVFVLIVSLTDSETASCKALHLSCHALRISVCATIDKISLPSSRLTSPKTTSLFRSLSQLRVTCSTDPSDPSINTAAAALPPSLTRLVIRTAVCCPRRDTVGSIIRRASRISCLSLTRTHSLKNNVTADAHLQTISEYCAPTLRSLTISGLSISPHAAHSLVALTGLTHLDLKDARPCEAHSALNALFATIQSMTSLRSLVVEAKSSAHLAAIATLSALTTLDIRPLTAGCKSSHSLFALAPLSTLHSLTLRKFHTTHLSTLLSCPTLASLRLLDCDISDVDLRCVALMTALTTLSMDNCVFAAAPAGTVFGGFAHELTSLRGCLKELHIKTVPRFAVPLQVVTSLNHLTSLSVDRADMPSNPIVPDPIMGGVHLPLAPLVDVEEVSDRNLALGCREFDHLASLPKLRTLEVASIYEGVRARARTIDPISIHKPSYALTALTILEQSLVWRPEGLGPRWPLIPKEAAPNLRRLSVNLYGAASDDDLCCLVDSLPHLHSLVLKGHFQKGLMCLTELTQLRELSVLTFKADVQDVVDVGVALSWQGLTRLYCQDARQVGKQLAARGKWGCVVASAGKW